MQYKSKEIPLSRVSRGTKLLGRRLMCLRRTYVFFFFFFNDTATTEIYTLSLHDALPIFPRGFRRGYATTRARRSPWAIADRKSTRLNSSHSSISYAVFCLKKKKTNFADKVSPNTNKKYNNVQG